MEASSGFEGSAGEYVGQVVVKASIVLGPDPEGERQDMTMEGQVKIREWPAEGYERRELEDGRVQIDLEMVESRITGQLGESENAIEITEHTADRNTGTLTQETPGQDFPARFELRRLISVDTPLGPLQNDQPIEIHATLDQIPPVAPSEAFSGINVFEAVNTPVPLLNADGDVAAFFSGSSDNETNCRVRMVSAESTA